MAHAYRVTPDDKQINPKDRYGRYNCTAYSLARILNYVTLGAFSPRITGALVRALSDEPTPDPASPGLNLPQMVTVAKRLRVELTDKTNDRLGWAGVMTALRERRPVLLQIDAFYYPKRLKKYTIRKSLPHAVVLEWVTKAGISLYDPMVGTEYYVTEAEIRPAAEKYFKTIRFAVGRVTPWLV
jgi:hypothetical protein